MTDRNALARLRFDLTDQAALQHYLVANLAVSGAALEHWASHFNRACQWYAHLLGHGFDRVPFFVVHDVGLLLLQGRGFRFRLLSQTGGGADSDTPDQHGDAYGAVRQRQVAYENRVLNRILALPAFEICVETLDEVGQRDDIVAMLLERLLEPLRDAPLPRVDAAAHQVRAAGLPGSTSPQNARATLAERAATLGEGTVSVQEVLDALDLSDLGDSGPRGDLLDAIAGVVSEHFQASSLRGLIGPEDAFVIRHFEVLGTRAQRMVARQLAELESTLGAAPPPPPQWRKETPQVSVDLDDAGYFPQGGLDELATRGSIENLVRSELVYLDRSEKLDLFTLRFAENELLYYTRDEGQLMRRSRAVHLVLDLAPMHDVLYPGHPARLSTLLRAAVHRMVDDLCALFEGEGDSLQVTLHAIGEGCGEVAAYWRVRFRERVDRGEINIVERAQRLDLSAMPSPFLVAGRVTSLIYFGEEEPLPAPLRLHQNRSGLDVFWVTLDEHEPGSAGAGATEDGWSFRVSLVDDDFLAALREVKTALVWRTFGGA